MINTKISILLGLILYSNTIVSQNMDIALLKDINLNRNTCLDGAFAFISNSAMYPEIAFPLAFISIGLIKKDKSIRDKGFEIGASVVLATLVSTSLKYSIDRQRPFVTYPELQRLSQPKDPSFPSGHTSACFALATTLSLNLPKWYVVAPAYIWASTVAYSRMSMGVHYPSDVLGGILVGSGSAILSHYVNKRLNKSRKKTTIPLD